jgi:hypothetical protein
MLSMRGREQMDTQFAPQVRFELLRIVAKCFELFRMFRVVAKCFELFLLCLLIPTLLGRVHGAPGAVSPRAHAHQPRGSVRPPHQHEPAHDRCATPYKSIAERITN